MTLATADSAISPVEASWALVPAWAKVMLGQVVIWGLLLGVWQVGASFVAGTQTLIGSPALVAEQLSAWMSDSQFWTNVGLTVKSALIGFAAGTAAACVAVAVSWPFAIVRQFLAPFLVIANAIPRIALAPLFILWFGIGTTSSAVFVASIIFLIVYLNVFSGLSSIDIVYSQNAKVLGAGRRWLAASVYIPAVTGWLMTSLRLAIVWAVLGASLAEYLAGSTGLGSYLARGNILGQPELLVGAAVVIAIISLLADRSLALIERKYSAWRLF